MLVSRGAQVFQEFQDRLHRHLLLAEVSFALFPGAAGKESEPVRALRRL